jgi:glyoxylase I family protein
MVTPAVQVTGINHVVLHVADMERSVRFYTEVLGFEGRRIASASDPDRMSFLRCGAQGLDLFERSGDVHGGEEMNHMALSVAAGELDQVMAALAEAGVDVSERTPRNTVFIHDPDGHRIEVLPARPPQRVIPRGGAAGGGRTSVP